MNSDAVCAVYCQSSRSGSSSPQQVLFAAFGSVVELHPEFLFSLQSCKASVCSDAGPNLTCSALLLSVAVRPVRCPPGFNSWCSVPPAANPEVMRLPQSCASAWFCFFFFIAALTLLLSCISEICHLHSSLFRSRRWDLPGHLQGLFTHGLKQPREAQTPQRWHQILKRRSLHVSSRCVHTCRSVYVHILSWLHATCWVIAQLVSTPDGLKSSKQQILCAPDQYNGAKVRAALQE